MTGTQKVGGFTGVGPLSKVFNPALLQGDCLINCKLLLTKAYYYTDTVYVSMVPPSYSGYSLVAKFLAWDPEG